MWHVALVAWNCVRSVALNALTLSSYYLLYHRSTPVRWKFKNQNTSNNCYPRDCKVYQYRMIMKKKRKNKRNNLLEAFTKKKKKRKQWIVKKTVWSIEKHFPYWWYRISHVLLMVPYLWRGKFVYKSVKDNRIYWWPKSLLLIRLIPTLRDQIDCKYCLLLYIFADFVEKINNSL